MKKTLCILAAAAVLLTGCIVTSVYPFYHPRDVAFDPALLGGWTNLDTEGESWSFAPDGTNSYQLTTTSQSETNVMQAHRFKMGREFFLDLWTSEGMKDAQPPPIPSHLLLRFFRTNNPLQLAVLDYDWLVRVLTNNPPALRHYVIYSDDKDNSGRLILSADTSDLQKFITKNLKTADAWKQRINLRRIDAPEK